MLSVRRESDKVTLQALDHGFLTCSQHAQEESALYVHSKQQRPS